MLPFVGPSKTADPIGKTRLGKSARRLSRFPSPLNFQRENGKVHVSLSLGQAFVVLLVL